MRSPVKQLLNTFLREADSAVAGRNGLAWTKSPRSRSLTTFRPDGQAASRCALPRRSLSLTSILLLRTRFRGPTQALNPQNDKDIDVGGVSKALARLGPGAKAALPILIGA